MRVACYGDGCLLYLTVRRLELRWVASLLPEPDWGQLEPRA